MDIESIAKIVDALKKMTATSMKDILIAVEMFKNSICEELSKKKDRLLINKAIDFMTGIENFSLSNFVEIVAQVLFQSDENAIEQIEDLLNLGKEMLLSGTDISTGIMMKTLYTTHSIVLRDWNMIML